MMRTIIRYHDKLFDGHNPEQNNNLGDPIFVTICEKKHDNHVGICVATHIHTMSAIQEWLTTYG